MNKIKLLVAGLVAITTIATGAVLNSENASAQTAPNCHVNVITPVTGLSDFGSNITTSGRTATAKFKVTGDANCKKAMTFASWKLPNKAGLPLEAQKLYTSTTRTYGVGTHSITVRTPDCYWQVDLLEGSRATSVNGDANYVWGKDRLMDFELGGDKSCEEKPQEPETPETPETPTTPETPLTSVEKLPSTGAGSIIASVLGLSTSTGLAYNYLQSRKKLS